MARAREHLSAAEEGHDERGLEEVRPERLDPDGSGMQASRRAIRAAALRLDGACLSLRRHARKDLDALNAGIPSVRCASLEKFAILPAKEIISMKEQLTAVFQQVPEGYIAFVEELPGANSQGDTLEEARTNLQEAVQLVLESNRALVEETLRNKTVIRETLASIS